ncbi:MAG: TonB-dependent receptor plug domain-containing protein [Bacteroidota bacterium]
MNPLRPLLCLAICLAFICHASYAQSIRVSGYVKDKQSTETLPGAVLYVNGKAAGAANVYGFYSLLCPKMNAGLSASFPGYSLFSVNISTARDTSLDLILNPLSISMQEVVIRDEKDNHNTSSTDMGRSRLDMKQLRLLPSFAGEVDILKAMQLTPGVKTLGDGNAAYYVRGGGPDQNLILIDEAQVYNPFHLLGFFSVFNENAVSRVELLKGGMPARYGGRLASVLDVQTKEGDSKKYRVEGGLGLISSRLTVQGPIKKDTASFIFSARRSYADIVAKPLFNNIERARPFRNSRIYFYDLNLKLNYRINSNNRVFLSGFLGRDVFLYSNKKSGLEVDIPWGNSIVSARWNHVFNRKVFLNTSLVFSDFRFSFTGRQADFDVTLYSGIRDLTLKSDLDIYKGARHRIKAGGLYTFHTFTPFNVSASQGAVDFNFGPRTRLYAHETALYVEDEFEPVDWLMIAGGIRAVAFQQVGPFDRYVKNPLGANTDTIRFTNMQPVVTYPALEPRLMMRISTGENSSIKASYTRNNQFLHLASLSPLSLPTDLWIPSTSLVKPQIGNQFSLGWFRNFFDNMYETSVEAYYKNMFNQVEFKEGYLPEESIGDNNDYAFTFGKGEAYGIEFFVKKKFGALQGWLGYTWSKTLRTFPEINGGETYYAPFDRRHDASVVLSYAAGKRWKFGLVWVYGTGRPITLPLQRYVFENQVSNLYSRRNAVRLEPYHRLDLSATLVLRSKRFSESALVFALFNAYSRLNPFFLYFDYSGALSNNTLNIQAKQVSLFPIIPSVTWNFAF